MDSPTRLANSRAVSLCFEPLSVDLVAVCLGGVRVIFLSRPSSRLVSVFAVFFDDFVSFGKEKESGERAGLGGSGSGSRALDLGGAAWAAAGAGGAGDPAAGGVVTFGLPPPEVAPSVKMAFAGMNSSTGAEMILRPLKKPEPKTSTPSSTPCRQAEATKHFFWRRPINVVGWPARCATRSA